MFSKKKQFFFINNGYSSISNIFDKVKIKQLSNKLKKILPNEKKIFYKNFKTFNKNARFKKITPGLKDNNILLSKDINLDFIEKNHKFNKTLKTFFNGNFYIESKWLIKILPLALMPNWVKEEVKDIGMPQLNMYMKDKYRNVAYLNGLDYHQDNGGRLRNSTTILIYLDPVLGDADSPIRILDKSHVLGATQYPHYCRMSSNKKIIYYSDLNGNHIQTTEKKIYGIGGTIIFFNGYTLHGSTIDDRKKKTRLALRYVFSPNKKSIKSIFEKSNKKIITKSFYIKNYRLDKMKNLYNKKCGKVINYAK
tara:strand:+ start:551 stop:1474 length:924 start_codon:yes stop_codon:yes gene_type:complete